MSGTVTLGGGTLSTVGIAASTALTFGALNLTATSTCSLSTTNAHTINFADSHTGTTWTAGQTLTIIGWQGNYNTGVSTTGKIFIGSSSSALTASQLAQIQFYDGTHFYSAILSSSGELVPDASGVTVTNTSPATGYIAINSTNNVLQSFNLAVATDDAILSGLTVTTAGTYASADLTNLKCWYSTSSTFSSGTSTLLSTATSPGGHGTSVVFPSFTSQTLISGSTYYIYVTADIPSSATLGNTISLATTSFSNFTFTTVTTLNGTNPVAASNTQTIQNYKYQTIRSGSWTSNTSGSETWQRSLDNATWVTVTSPTPTPDFTDDAITILTGNVVSLPSNLTVDQLTITGELDINSGIVLTANDGTGTDITVNGTLDLGMGTLTGAGNIVTNSGSTIKTANSNGMAGSSASIQNTPTTANSYSTTGTVNYYGTTQTITTTPSGAHLSLSGSTNATPAGAISCNNLTINSGAVLIGIKNTISVAGNWSNYSTAGFTEGKSTVVFNGSSAQSLSCSGGEDFTNLTMNGSGGLTLTTDSARVDSVLALTNGILTTNNILKVNLKRGEIAYTSGDAGNISGNVLAWKNELNLGNHYISAPVTGCAASVLENYTRVVNPLDGYTGLYYFGSGAWQNIPYTALSSTIFTSLQGYSLYYTAPVNFAFYGGYNHTASYSLNFTSNSAQNYELVGNPYPSDVDWTLFSNTHINGAIYYWNSATNAYLSYVFGSGTNTATQYVPAMQGFWVQTDGSGSAATVSVNNSARVTLVSALYRVADAPSPFSALSLKAASGSYSDELVVRFMQGATTNFDGQFDAVKFMNADSTPSFYSVLADTNYSINSLPDTFSYTIPLNFVPTFNGAYTISASPSDSSYTYVLVDTLQNISQDLRVNPNYTFASSTTDNTARFYLRAEQIAGPPAPGGATATISALQQKVVIGSNQKTIKFFFENINNEEMSFGVYNIIGQQLLSASASVVSSGIYAYPADQLPTGVYIVKLLLAGQVYTGKIVLE